MTRPPEVSGTREDVLAHIRAATTPPTIDEVATALGRHRNSIRTHAAALQEAGLVTQDTRPSGGRGRPLVVYRPTSRGARAGRRNYELLAEMLVENIAATQSDPMATARNAGQSWGRRMADERTSTDLVPEVLQELGFEPTGSGTSIELHNCPFRELVDSHRDLVCSLHAGMLDGVAGDREVELVPFASPRTCAVQLDDV